MSAGTGAIRPPDGDASSAPNRADLAPEREAGLAAGAGAAVFLAGVWLVMAPYALNYQDLTTGFDGFWNDIVVGVAVAVVAAIRMVTPIRTAALSLVHVILGGWLIIAPFVLEYHLVADAGRATWNDIVVGLIVVLLGLASAALGFRGRRIRRAA
jgi:hypothetical protein